MTWKKQTNKKNNSGTYVKLCILSTSQMYLSECENCRLRTLPCFCVCGCAWCPFNAVYFWVRCGLWSTSCWRSQRPCGYHNMINVCLTEEEKGFRSWCIWFSRFFLGNRAKMKLMEWRLEHDEQQHFAMWLFLAFASWMRHGPFSLSHFLWGSLLTLT